MYVKPSYYLANSPTWVKDAFGFCKDVSTGAGPRTAFAHVTSDILNWLLGDFVSGSQKVGFIQELHTSEHSSG